MTEQQSVSVRLQVGGQSATISVTAGTPIEVALSQANLPVPDGFRFTVLGSDGSLKRVDPTTPIDGPCTINGAPASTKGA